MHAPPLIRLGQLGKVFQTEEVETHALAGVDLEIHRGDYVAVAGPSGCGKSTLLSILGLLDTPSEGEYLLDGGPVAGLPAGERARIRNREVGFVFRAFNLILHADGATICMVTHDPRYAGHAGKTIHLFDGRVVGEEGAVAGPGAETLTSKVG